MISGGTLFGKLAFIRDLVKLADLKGGENFKSSLKTSAR
jgi:hypothetical protein